MPSTEANYTQRVGLYPRYSSDLQSAALIEDSGDTPSS